MDGETQYLFVLTVTMKNIEKTHTKKRGKKSIRKINLPVAHCANLSVAHVNTPVAHMHATVEDGELDDSSVKD
eukprot:7225952-Ditylum_brightwellii.AAC.1